MTTHSPHRRWKGCHMCKMHKDHRHGDAYRTPPSVMRRVAGRSRRWNRHDVSDD